MRGERRVGFVGLVIDMGSSDPLETVRLQPLSDGAEIALLDAPATG